MIAKLTSHLSKFALIGLTTAALAACYSPPSKPAPSSSQVGSYPPTNGLVNIVIYKRDEEPYVRRQIKWDA